MAIDASTAVEIGEGAVETVIAVIEKIASLAKADRDTIYNAMRAQHKEADAAPAQFISDTDADLAAGRAEIAALAGAVKELTANVLNLNAMIANLVQK